MAAARGSTSVFVLICSFGKEPTQNERAEEIELSVLVKCRQ